MYVDDVLDWIKIIFFSLVLLISLVIAGILGWRLIKQDLDSKQRNEADSIINNTEKALEDLKDKVSTKDKENAEDKIKELKKALEGKDIDDIKKKSEDLQKVAMDLGAKVYEEAAKANAQTESKSDNDETDNGSSDKNDGVEEAHYEEK